MSDTKKRIILIVILVLVLAGISGGIYLYVRRSAPEKLLQRANLALKAKQYEEAAELAAKYSSKKPDDWRGYQRQGDAYLRLGRYEEARKAFDRGSKCPKAPLDPSLGIAKRYSHPAMRLLAEKKKRKTLSELEEAVTLLERSVEVLDGLETKTPADRRVQEALGGNQERIGYAQGQLAELYRKNAKVAAEANNETQKKQAEKQANNCDKAAKDAYAEAYRSLWRVVQSDQVTDTTAQILFRVVKEIDEPEKQKELFAAIEKHDKNLPIAKTKVMMERLEDELLHMSFQEREKKLDKTKESLSELMKKHPQTTGLKIELMRIALRKADYEACDSLAEEILKDQPRHLMARMLQARSLLERNESEKAEEILFRLKADKPGWANAHYFYALAADASGKKELAKQAMREAVKQAKREVGRIPPDHAPARRYLIGTLLREGFLSEAVEDAKGFYDAAPENPIAIGLYVDCLKKNDQVSTAREVLNEVREKNSAKPVVLRAVMAGFKILEDWTELGETAKLIANLPAKSVEEKFIRAKAMELLGRIAEGESELSEIIKACPSFARGWFEMAGLHDRTNRSIQAAECYQRAVQLEPNITGYRLALARRLFASGLLEEARQEYQTVLSREPGNAEAISMTDRVKAMLHKPDQPVPELPLVELGAKDWYAVARRHLRRGNPEKCIELCMDRLKSDAEDLEARALLADVYLQLDQLDDFLAQSSEILKRVPDSQRIYLRIARVLSSKNTLEEIRQYLQGIPNTRKELVGITVAQLLVEKAGFEGAVAELDQRLKAVDLNEDQRDIIRFARAQALAAGKRIDEALAELEKLEKKEHWRKRARLFRAKLLLFLPDRRDEGVNVLEGMAKEAEKNEDLRILEESAKLLVRARRFDKALSVCQMWQKLRAKEPQPLLMQARILAKADRLPEATQAVQQAIDLQPENLSLHVELARFLELQNEPDKVLEVLKALEDRGEAGKVYALFEKVAVFIHWGLFDQAIETIEKLDELGHGKEPPLLYERARALAVIGERASARKILATIPVYSQWYARAQRLLVDQLDSTEEKLAILQTQEKKYPGQVDVQLQKLRVLVDAKRYDDVVASYENFVAKQFGKHLPPMQLSETALQILLSKPDYAAAGKIARDITAKLGPRVWRSRAMLLEMVHNPNTGLDVLNQQKELDGLAMLLGLAHAIEQGQAEEAKVWANRFTTFRERIAQDEDQRRRNFIAKYHGLVALAIGEKNLAKAEFDKADKTERIMADSINDILSQAEANSTGSPREAAALIKCLLAQDLGMPRLGVQLAQKILHARPQCQWAAGLVMNLGGDSESLRTVVKLLQPKDCFLGQVARAKLLMREREYGKASDVFRQILSADKGNPQWKFELAVALERADKKQEALKLYQDVIKELDSKSPVAIIAANNAAYLVSLMYSSDLARLAEAQEWISRAVQSTTNVPSSFQDTQGWITFLQGDAEKAATLVRAAGRGLPNSPQVHYHLGRIEQDLGHTKRARWHFQAAIRHSEVAKRRGQPLEAADAHAVAEAQKCLAKFDQESE